MLTYFLDPAKRRINPALVELGERLTDLTAGEPCIEKLDFIDLVIKCSCGRLYGTLEHCCTT